jgi:hypothetical protein
MVEESRMNMHTEKKNEKKGKKEDKFILYMVYHGIFAWTNHELVI